MAEWCQDFELHASQVIDWKRQLLEGAADRGGSGCLNTELASIRREPTSLRKQ